MGIVIVLAPVLLVLAVIRTIFDVIPTTVDENESADFDWEHAVIRPYDNKKDW